MFNAIFNTDPMIKAAKQKMVKMMPYFRNLKIGIANRTTYSIVVKHKLYTKSTPSVEYANAKPQMIDEMCWNDCGMSTGMESMEWLHDFFFSFPQKLVENHDFRFETFSTCG